MITLGGIIRRGRVAVLGPSMTVEADRFVTKYRKVLDATAREADAFLADNCNSTMCEFLTASKRLLDELSDRQARKFGREMDMYLPIHTMIYMLGRKLMPGKAVETGVEKGGSTYMLLKAMQANHTGHLWSVDKHKYWRYRGQVTACIGPLVTQDLKPRWTFIKANAQKRLSSILETVGELDMFGALQGHTFAVQKHETELAWPLLRSGGVFVLDRPDWNDGKYLKSFLLANGDEVSCHKTYPEGASNDTYEFTILIKK